MKEPLTSRRISPLWWLLGGCAFLIACLLAAAAGAAIGWVLFGPIRPAQVIRSPERPAAIPTASATPEGAPARLRGNPVGQLAPDFTLLDVDGNPVRLHQFRGQPVLINFWATWCGPCRQEMPIIEAAYQKYKAQGLVVLAVDVQENPELAKTFAGWLKITFTLLDDGDGEVARRYRVTGLPTSFFVDRDGVIRAWQVGAMDEAVLEKHLAEILR